MDADLSRLRRLSELELASFEHRPALHRHQVAAHRAQLERLAAAPTVAAFTEAQRRRGDGFAVARAEWCDRQANEGWLWRALGEIALADQAEAAIARMMSVDQRHFVAVLQREARGWAAAQSTAMSAATAFLQLAGAAIASRFAGDGMQLDDVHAVAAATAQQLVAADPRFVLSGVLETPRYRLRLPFHGDAAETILGWVDVLTQGALRRSPAATVAPTPDDPPLDESAAESSEIEASLSPSAAAAVPSEDELATRLEIMRAPSLALARDGLAWAEARGQVLAAQHHRALADALAAAKTPTEVAHEVALAHACFAIEAAWAELFFHAATAPIEAVSWQELDPGRARAVAVAAAVRVHDQLLGGDVAAALAGPVMAPLLDDLYLARGQATALAEGALLFGLGHVGLRALAPMRAATAVRLARGGSLLSTRHDLVQHLVAAMPATVAAAPRRVCLWNRVVAADELAGIFVPALRPKGP